MKWSSGAALASDYMHDEQKRILRFFQILLDLENLFIGVLSFFVQ